MINTANKIIFTTQPQASQIGLNEIALYHPKVKFFTWLDAGVGIIELMDSYEEVIKTIMKNPPIFIRHFCPVSVTNEIEKDLKDMESFIKLLEELTPLMEKEKTFSVQVRILEGKDLPYKKFDIITLLANKLEALGYKLDIQNPTQIISVVIKENMVYAGASLSEDNLSNWAGGMHRFAREEGQISRAEFKLLETFDVYHINVTGLKKALDLGAAPGGWTKVLRSFGISVVAVDPAELNPEVAADSGVYHFRGLAQDYIEEENEFDLIVNDMRMDARESAKLMGIAVKSLKEKGLAIMTLKLPEKGQQKITNQTLKLLAQWYDIYGARQLFHNRSEVTVILKKKKI